MKRIWIIVLASMFLLTSCDFIENVQTMADRIMNSETRSSESSMGEEEQEEDTKENPKDVQGERPIEETDIVTYETRVIPIAEGDVGNIYLPEYLMDGNIHISVEEIFDYDMENEPEHCYVYDIDLEGIEVLNDIVKIELYYPGDDLPIGVDESTYIGAMIYDEDLDEWVYPYYELDTEKNTVTILTEQLTQCALVGGINRKACEPAAISTIEIQSLASVVETISLEDKALIKEAISAMDTGFSTVSKFVPDDIAEAVIGSKNLEFQQFGDMCKTYSKAKFLVKYVQALEYVDKEDSYDKRKAILDLGKDVYDNAVGELLGNYSSKLAGIGTFFIEYSFNKFVDAAISGNETAWNDMYKDYYFTTKGGKSLIWWRDALSEIVENTEFDESPSDNIKTFVTKYMNELWDDEAELSSLVQERDKLSLGGLSEELKKKIVEGNMKWMYESRVYPAMELLRDYNKQMAEIELAKALTELETSLFSEKYFDIYYDVPSQYQGQYAMERVDLFVGDTNEMYYMNSMNMDVHRTVDHHQFYYKPVDLLMTGTELTNVMAVIPLKDTTNKNVVANFVTSLPSYNAVHIVVPDDYIEFEALEEQTETVTLNLTVIDDSNDNDIEFSTIVINGQTIELGIYNNEIEVPISNIYDVRVISSGYEDYTGEWEHDVIIGQYLGVALTPIQMEIPIELSRLPIDVLDYDTNDSIPFDIFSMTNCSYDTANSEMIIYDESFSFEAVSSGYVGTGVINLDLWQFDRQPFILLKMTKVDEPDPDPVDEPLNNPVEDTVIVQLKIVQYHYQNLLNTTKGATVVINGTTIDYDPEPDYMEIEIPKASSYNISITPKDPHTYPSDSTLYNDANYLILPINETIYSDQTVIDAPFIFISPYSLKNVSFDDKGQYRGYYGPER